MNNLLYFIGTAVYLFIAFVSFVFMKVGLEKEKSFSLSPYGFQAFIFGIFWPLSWSVFLLFMIVLKVSEMFKEFYHFLYNRFYEIFD